MSRRAPRVSVGLPVRNGGRYLSAAIDSILNQTFTDFELIVSDNGSTDQTAEICRAYVAADPRIRYVRNAQNAGGAWNFRRVVELSSAPYFKWHSHDDLCAPEMIERCVEILDRMPEVILCYARTTVIDEHGLPMMAYDDQLHLNSPDAYHRYKQYHEHFRVGAACNAHYGLIRRSILLQTPLIGAYSSSDLVLLGELAMRGQFFELPERLFMRRDHPEATIRLFPNDRERNAWFDPARTRTVRFPIWRLVWEHLAAINRTPLSPYQRLRCRLLVGAYLGWHVPIYLAVARGDLKYWLPCHGRPGKA